MGYAEIAHAHVAAESRFTAALLNLDPESPLDWGETTTDEYDDSIEFMEVPNDCRLTLKQQKFIHDEGFYQCWLNHKDGWETHYILRDAGFVCPRTDRAKERAVPTRVVSSAE